MNILMIGAGNVAWHLATALEQKGNHISVVYSRNLENAQLLAQQLNNALATNHTNFSEVGVDLAIVAVKDDAIAPLVAQMQLPPQTIIAHTSGNTPLQVFEHLNGNNDFGVFYPLQTFSKNSPVDFTAIPFCIEGINANTETILFDLASQLSPNIHSINSFERKVLHVAAVIACNFTNHLFAQSAHILQREDISFDLLKPLIKETIQKALNNDPRETQTGPAVRNDTKVIQDHLQYLKNNPSANALYTSLTDSILQWYT
ncbi:Rossmann-like and DUF2520 domain-containing protein [uncultured Microscilla sp.]|uniref:Rossmann-like and DUF2520 domain-containing protein n=1 Tax=uncultured Microscilla sp. TaxID=432653 RepID=UPI0026052C5A|nr:Rossmann-like and DUF2520 domain-containing protein [uncultured Microscilla sp.]